MDALELVFDPVQVVEIVARSLAQAIHVNVYPQCQVRLSPRTQLYLTGALFSALPVPRCATHVRLLGCVRACTDVRRAGDGRMLARSLRIIAELDITAAQLANQRVATELAIAGYGCELFLAVVPQSKHTLAYGIGALHMGLVLAERLAPRTAGIPPIAEAVFNATYMVSAQSLAIAIQLAIPHLGNEFVFEIRVVDSKK